MTPHAEFSFTELVEAYFACRSSKRYSATALAFEANLEGNLVQLDEDLRNGTYTPGPSICFVITRPKPREVWAAQFRDRIVHHLFYKRVSPRFHATFVPGSCACIPGKGTLYGAKHLESHIRSITENWSRPAYYLKMDLANFFVSIDKRILFELLAKKIAEPWWLRLAHTILFHDPRTDYQYQGKLGNIELVPHHKRLTSHDANHGLPIGNLSSQFFANILLNELDQFCKHRIRARYYVRYVDDFILLHESAAWLNDARAQIEAWLPEHLGVNVNPRKTILQPVDRGVDFVGQVIKPHYRTTRKRTRNAAIKRIATMPADQLFETANSYFGLFGQASSSHSDRAALANVLRQRGHSINRALTQTYRRG